MDRPSAIDGLEPAGRVPPPQEAIEVGSIEFRDMSFSYPFRPEVRVLQSLSFKIQSGQSVGLVAPSGGGKSTIMALLQRFYDPQMGAVLIGQNATPLSEFSIRWWRKQVGFVGQEPILFDTTVRNNVFYGLEAGDEEKITADQLE